MNREEARQVLILYGIPEHRLDSVEEQLRLYRELSEALEALGRVASLAHCAGLVDLSEHETLVLIRRLTLGAFNLTGSEAETRERVAAALRAARK